MDSFLTINLKYLRKKNNKSQSDIALHVNKRSTAVSSWENGLSEPSIADLGLISDLFGAYVGDLIGKDLRNVNLNENEGDKKIEENVNLNVNHRVNLNEKKGQLEPISSKVRELTYIATPQGQNITQIPITDISVAAGTGVFNNDYIENMDFFGFPNHLLKPGRTYLSVRIKGASMAPTLQDGGYMAIRLIEKGEWSKLRDERIYVVSDIDGKSYLKRVKNRFKQGFIVLMSDSPDKATYPSFNLQSAEIVSIWEAEFYISAKMPNIHAQYYSRLQELEDRMDDVLKMIKK